jgi:hypothetical protein
LYIGERSIASIHVFLRHDPNSIRNDPPAFSPALPPPPEIALPNPRRALAIDPC